jgi:hypothetical protein
MKNIKRGEIMEHEYASKGVAGAGLGLGIAGTALGLMAGGNGLGGLFNVNGNCGCSEDHTVNRYELGLQQELAAKDTRISLLESNIYVDSKIADVYERLNGRINCIEGQLADQRVFNATNTAVLNCVNSQVASLMALTKTVIPNASICPGWGDVTVAPATTTTAGA